MKITAKKDKKTTKNLPLPLIMDSVSSGVIVVDSHDKILFVNPAAIDILERNNNKGRMLKDLLPKGKTRFFKNGIKRLRNNKGLKSLTLRTEINKKTVKAGFSHIKDEKGKILATLITLQDITEDASRDDKKTNFMSDVSHALRTPITAIQGAADLLLKGIGGIPNKKHAEFVRIISKNCKRLNNLINDVVRIARFESVKVLLSLKKTDLVPLIEYQLDKLSGRIREKEIEIERIMPSSVRIDADAERIGEVFAILMGNAIRYTPGKKRIRISVDVKADASKSDIEFKTYNPDTKSGFAEVCIHNQYKGITGQELNRLFDKYVKIKNFELEGNKPDTDGKVLNLPMAKILVESHDGKIWIENEGGGCSFYFTIPIYKRKTNKEDGQAPFTSGPLQRLEKWSPPIDEKVRVLLVNDNPHEGRRLRQAIEKEGFSVYEGANKEDAIDLARRFRPNIIVIDVVMPEIDGTYLVKVLREDPETKEIPIIVFSASDEENARLKDVKAINIIKRSMDEKTLVKDIKATLQHHRMAEPGEKILIVDDERSITSLITSMLQEFGYTTIEASTGEEALSIAQAEQPDLILLDINLPGIDGFQTLKRLKNSVSTGRIPVILLSGIKDAKEKARGLNLGASDYITKPYSSLELEARVRLLLQRREEEHSTSPTTRLPGNIAIEREINAKIKEKAPFSVCYIDLDNFKAYNDNYGFLKGDAVIKQTAKIITDVVREYGNDSDFVGHIGGDDFIIITTNYKDDIICSGIIDAFSRIIPLYYNREDRNRGLIELENRRGQIEKFPIMTMSIAVVTSNEQRRLEHMAQISDIAAELKKAAKKMEGSVVIRDRRLSADDIARSDSPE
ncbi:MAG: response regulator [Nitrospirota bacterium]